MHTARAMSTNCSTADAIHGTVRGQQTTRSNGAGWRFRHARYWLAVGAAIATLVMWPQARHAAWLILEIAWLYFVTGARG